ncbi:MAG TPA: hypothetical protein VMS86_06035 [Thermoanaerobaculia bacterium]|nr:hypothetical protein [Thermoanaerobaculia bacterium]
MHGLEPDPSDRFRRLYASDRAALASLALLAVLYYGGSYLAGGLLGRSPQSGQTHYAYLAEAMLEGRLDLPPGRAPHLSEIVSYRDQRFVVYPPLPAIVLLPAVALFGAELETSLLSIALAAVGLAATFVWLRRLGRPRDVAWWSALLLGLGTSYTYAAIVGSSWLLAHVLGVLLLTAAMCEVYGRNRGVVAGLLIGGAMWCRMPMVLAAPFAMYLAGERSGRRVRSALQVGAGVAVFLVLNALYNWLRFDDVRNVAYTMIPGVLAEPWYERGIFDLAYLPRNLHVLLFEPPVLLDSFPYFAASLWGLGVVFATPAYLLMLWAPFGERTTRVLLAAAVACMLPGLFHGWPGAQQYGYRFSLDAAPFLVALMALGIGDRVTPRVRALLVLNLALTAWWIAFARWVPPRDWIYPFG